jgi:hypothetical protein
MLLVMGMTMTAGSGAMAALAGQAAAQVDMARDGEFQAWLSRLLETIHQDRHYSRLPLDSEAETSEFTDVLHRLYRNQITDADFMAWVDARYPGHQYEQFTILKALHESEKSLGAGL